MDISNMIKSFAAQKQQQKSKPYFKICKPLLLGSKPYSLNSQPSYWESEYLASNIRASVEKYSSNKDMAITLYKDLVSYLKKKGVAVPEIKFPPIPVSNSFERLMFIAKYLQDSGNKISRLKDILWVSDRTIEEDLKKLRDSEDPIQVCGKKFFVPDTGRRKDSLHFSSTAHPVFLAENLTQVLVMLKGLKAMSENPLYEPYAKQTAREIWGQLSPYAKKRIRFVLEELMPADYAWYKALSEGEEDRYFHTESACSRINNAGPHVVLECIKNDKPFCVEYEADGKTYLYTDCRMEKGSYRGDPPSVVVNCSGGHIRLQIDHIIRSAYTIEELAAN